MQVLPQVFFFVLYNRNNSHLKIKNIQSTYLRKWDYLLCYSHTSLTLNDVSFSVLSIKVSFSSSTFLTAIFFFQLQPSLQALFTYRQLYWIAAGLDHSSPLPSRKPISSSPSPSSVSVIRLFAVPKWKENSISALVGFAVCLSEFRTRRWFADAVTLDKCTFGCLILKQKGRGREKDWKEESSAICLLLYETVLLEFSCNLSTHYSQIFSVLQIA